MVILLVEYGDGVNRRADSSDAIGTIKEESYKSESRDCLGMLLTLTASIVY